LLLLYHIGVAPNFKQVREFSGWNLLFSFY
jgi:hypothetical protein